MKRVKFLRLKKYGVSFIAVVAMMIGMSISVFAAEGKDIIIPEGYFTSVSGVVENITIPEKSEVSYMIHLKTNQGQPATFRVKPNAYWEENLKEKLAVGMKITGFYQTGVPMVMIYPPQYPIEIVLAEVDKNTQVKADRFDKNGVSTDGFLQYRVGEETQIILQDGSKYDGSLENRKLIVYYSVSTRSVPAQMTPTKIIVLFEEAQGPLSKMEKGEAAKPRMPDVSQASIVVKGKVIEAPSPYNRPNPNKTIMVPARAVLTALGYRVDWDEETGTVMVNQGISSFTINSPDYTYGRMAPIRLEASPEIKDGYAYVPLSYFKRVLKIDEVYVFEGQIVFNLKKTME